MSTYNSAPEQNKKGCYERINKFNKSMKRGISTMICLIARIAIRYPTSVLIVIPVFSASILSVGYFTNFTLQTDFSKVFPPDNSKALVYREWITDLNIPPEKYEINVLLHARGENVLTKDAFGILFEAYNVVQSAPTYPRACSQEVSPDTCDFTGIINLFNNNYSTFNLTVGDDETLLQVLGADDLLKDPSISDMLFGRPIRNANGLLYSAQSLKLLIQIPTHLVDGEIYKKGTETNPSLFYDEVFERDVVNRLVEFRNTLKRDENDYVLEVISSDSWLAEGNRTIEDDLYLVVVVFILICVITSFFFFAKNRVESSMLMGVGAVVCILCSGCTSFGILFTCGFSVTPLTMTIVFVLFGVGLDDTFVIVGAYKRTDKSLKIEERIEEALKDCGVSIFLTTTTTSSAFLLGLTSQVPGLRDYFVFASLSIFVDFLYQITFFIALLIKDEKRKIDNRTDCIVCLRVPHYPDFDDERSSLIRYENERVKSGDTWVSNFLLRYCNLLYTSELLRVIVMIIFVVFSIVASVYVGQLQVKFSSDALLPDNSYVKQYVLSDAKYYKGKVARVLFFRFLDYESPSARSDMERYLDDLASLDEVPYRPDAWFEDFGEWESVNFSMHGNLTFDEKLSLFLEEEVQGFESQLIRDSKNQIVASKVILTVNAIGLSDGNEQLALYKKLWSVDEENYHRMNPEISSKDMDPKNFPMFSYHPDDIFWEFFELLPHELLFTTIISFGVICFLVVLFIPNLVAIGAVIPSVVMIYVDILGLMHWCGLFITPITLIAIIMSLGLLVDFVLHIVMASFEEMDSKQIDIRYCMETTGSSVFIGALTTIISTSPLLFSTSTVFKNIFFIFFSFVILSLLHGLIFVPSVLVYFDNTSEHHKLSRPNASRVYNSVQIASWQHGGSLLPSLVSSVVSSMKKSIMSQERRASLIARMKASLVRPDYEQIANDVEDWARSLIDENAMGWNEIRCNRVVRRKFNPTGETSCYIKWMKDSRGSNSCSDEQEYPCVKMLTTIDAPIADVCEYLSREEHLREYNDFVDAYCDVEEITPHSKICWAKTPQILFFKPKDFVNFCHYRWTDDGSQIIVSQAVDHPDLPENDDSSRAYIFRSATFIEIDPQDPNKTKMSMLQHGSPGGKVSRMVMNAGVNVVAPIESFKLCHRIRTNASIFSTKFNSATQYNSSSAGIALTSACFWNSNTRNVNESIGIEDLFGENPFNNNVKFKDDIENPQISKVVHRVEFDSDYFSEQDEDFHSDMSFDSCSC